LTQILIGEIPCSEGISPMRCRQIIAGAFSIPLIGIANPPNRRLHPTAALRES
jgi:hypothetical protein